MHNSLNFECSYAGKHRVNYFRKVQNKKPNQNRQTELNFLMNTFSEHGRRHAILRQLAWNKAAWLNP